MNTLIVRLPLDRSLASQRRQRALALREQDRLATRSRLVDVAVLVAGGATPSEAIAWTEPSDITESEQRALDGNR